MKRRYAETTEVPIDRSKAEIERILARYGATGFMYGNDGNRALVMFRANGKMVRFVLNLPDLSQFSRTPTGRQRRSDKIPDQYAQEVRRMWRSLSLLIKAKLEAVGSNITIFEEEFMPHIVMPNGKTVAEAALPMIEQAYASGKMPVALLPGLS